MCRDHDNDSIFIIFSPLVKRNNAGNIVESPVANATQNCGTEGWWWSIMQNGREFRLYDEKLPYYYMYYRYPNDLAWWPYLMQPYMKNWQLVVCPSKSWSLGSTIFMAGHPNPLVCSYALPAINRNAAHALIPTLYEGTLAQVPEPSDTIMIAESVGSEIFTAGSQDYHLTDIINPASAVCKVQTVHNDGSNYTFVDGHSKWLKRSMPGMWTLPAGD
ncbi:MAG: hypothetical protein ACYC63_10880 [Armatimonadota bacterium]